MEEQVSRKGNRTAMVLLARFGLFSLLPGFGGGMTRQRSRQPRV